MICNLFCSSGLLNLPNLALLNMLVAAWMKDAILLVRNALRAACPGLGQRALLTPHMPLIFRGALLLEIATSLLSDTGSSLGRCELGCSAFSWLMCFLAWVCFLGLSTGVTVQAGLTDPCFAASCSLTRLLIAFLATKDRAFSRCLVDGSSTKKTSMSPGLLMKRLETEREGALSNESVLGPAARTHKGASPVTG